MIPILYNTVTEGTVPSDYGVGALTDCLACSVSEERNGKYELSMSYAADGIHANDIAYGKFIIAKPNFSDNPQIFRIYKVGKKMNGRFEVKGQHISYDLGGKIITSGTAASSVAACTLLTAQAGAFTINTDKTLAASFEITEPSSVRSWFGGKKGSFLDVYGPGEWHYDNYTCSFKAARGQNRGVQIRYGKNLTELSQEIDMSNLVTGVIPYYIDANDGTKVVGTKVSTGLTFDVPRDVAINFSTDVDPDSATPIATQLNTLANKYISNNDLTHVVNSITLNFVQLSNLQERVDLCDTVSIYFEALGISMSAKCVATTWDVLAERYTSTTFGSSRVNIADTIAATNAELNLTQSEISSSSADAYAKAKAYTDAVKAVLDDDISDLQDQIDGNITTWYYDYVPTTSNPPADGWTTPEEKEEHAGDLFFDNTTQLCYRWTYDNGAWDWVLVQDSSIAQAIGLAQDAYDLADNKRRVFITTPVPPYDVGDLWTDQDNIYYCQTAKAEGESYSSADWRAAVDKVTATAMQTAINNATKLITGNLGGYVVLHDTNNDGEPEEILIMDTADISTAQKVWRWNANGLGYSSTGYSGTYSTAITSDGKIVADFITTGTLSANLIKAGVIEDAGHNSSIDMTSGVASFKNLIAKNKFTHIDANGKIRTLITYNVSDGTSLIFRDTGGTDIVQLFANPSNGGNLILRNVSGNTVAYLEADGTSQGGELGLRNSNNKLVVLTSANNTGEGYLNIYNASGNLVAYIEADGTSQGGDIGIYNASGQLVGTLYVTTSNGGGLVLKDPSGVNGAQLYSGTAGGNLCLRSPNNKIIAELFAGSSDQDGILNLRDSSGNQQIWMKGQDGSINCKKVKASEGIQSLYSGTLSSGYTTFNYGDYNSYIVFAHVHSGGSLISMTIPKDIITGSDQNFCISDEIDYIVFRLKKAGTTTTLTIGNMSSDGWVCNVYGVY